MDAVGTLKLLKYARIIKGFAEQMKIPYAKAMDLFSIPLHFNYYRMEKLIYIAEAICT